MENFLEQSAEQLVISKVLSINFPNFNKGCFMNSTDIFIYKKTFHWKKKTKLVNRISSPKIKFSSNPTTHSNCMTINKN